MSKISKSEDGGLLVDGKAFDAADYALSDEDLASASGGVQAYKELTRGRRYVKCECGSKDFDIIETNEPSIIKCKCQVCGSVCTMYADGMIVG